MIKHAGAPAGFSIGSLGRDKSDLFNGEGAINSFFTSKNAPGRGMDLTAKSGAAAAAVAALGRLGHPVESPTQPSHPKTYQKVAFSKPCI